MSQDKLKKGLLDELKNIQQRGIQADRHNLKQNMYTQFADPFEFAREYVVNSYDALATACYISGRETDDTVTITIRDNGKGMNYERIQDYFKIFRSRKDSDTIKPIGRFGVGKMSVAAVPGLIKFAGVTSTGMECWRFETDSMIDDLPITLERVEPVPAKGTKFEITFKKTASLYEQLTRIYQLLHKYVRFLKIDIYFDLPEVDEHYNPKRKKLEKGNWQFDPENIGKTYHIKINDIPVEVILGLGKMEHEIFQNQVYITSKYNLVSFGLQEQFNIPHLRIRVNSDIFELTFGRHCLSNESVLISLSKEIREKILPSYYDYLMDHIDEDFIVNFSGQVTRIEEMTCGLLMHRTGGGPWNSFRLFRLHDSSRISFNELHGKIKESGIVYFEATGCIGLDYMIFDAPVLKIDQPKGAQDLLKIMFRQRIINLNEQDVVLEIPKSIASELSMEEKYFERHLLFKPKMEVLNWILKNADRNGNPLESKRKQMDELENSLGICEEARIAENDFYSIQWKVNYLVERDAKTPCYSRKFIFKNNTIILNLNHPEIKQFIQLSHIDANLAAHWAMAMCLADSKLISHITSDAREDLLLIDAMGRMTSDFNPSLEPVKKENKSILDFLRNCSQSLF